MISFLDMDLSKLSVPERTLVRKIFTCTKNTPDMRTFFLKRESDVDFAFRLLKQIQRLVGQETGYVFPMFPIFGQSLVLELVDSSDKPSLGTWLGEKATLYKENSTHKYSLLKTKFVEEIPNLVFVLSSTYMSEMEKSIFRSQHRIINSYHENKYIFLMI